MSTILTIFLIIAAIIGGFILGIIYILKGIARLFRGNQ